jgi:hypothetical protein
MMSVALSERALYERKRRRNVIREAREYRVITPWLRKLYPEILEEFKPFLNKLQRENPKTRDLTTTGDFRRFMRVGRGMVCVYVWCG